jgi:hypothetical protein
MKTIEIETDSPIVNFAREELSRIGDVYDGMVNEAALDIVGLFATQGHSGGSAQLTTEIAVRLLRYEPLSPLTGADDEWTGVSESCGGQTWQNKRCSHVFKDETRAWDIDLPRDGDQWTTISFPYVPA